MKIGVIIPDKKDRPLFLRNCLEMMERQSVPVDYIALVNEESGINGIDISWRYKRGLDICFNKQDCDVVFFIENDDWYSNDYIETMLIEWDKAGQPALFGIETSIYYHLGLKKYKNLIHKGRASAFSTMVTLEILGHQYCKDDDAFYDLHLWHQNIEKKTFITSKPIAVGIKHGEGACGGKGHLNTFPYDKADPDMKYLKSIVDHKSFEFYNGFK